MARRVSAEAALSRILCRGESETDSDNESNNSISDAEYEVHEDENLTSDGEDEAMSTVASLVQSPQDQEDQSMNQADDILEAGIAAGVQPEVGRHIDDCINAVVDRFRGRFIGPNGTVWNENPLPNGRRQAVNVMRAAGGLSALGRRRCGETALSNWQLFVTDDMLDTIVECTNEKAQSTGADFVTTRQELATFIGVSILIGVFKGRGEPIRGIWSESEGRKCISQFMTRNRFELITKYIRFDLTNTRETRRQTTKFAPMGYVYDMWEQNLSKPFIPYEYVTVDETLVPFRGRCSFKQYMPSKPAKYGLKFWCLCDAKTGYCIHMKPYLGADGGAARQTGLGKQVVLDLTERLDVGRTVVTDNYFTSLALTQELRNRNLGHIGTVRKNRRELPPEFTAKKSDAGSCVFGFNDDATLVSYAPKKNKRVVLISSEHSNEEVDAVTGKPQIILTYNQGKGGVDHLDQMCGAYTTRKRTNRWPKCVFQHMIDVTAFNAFVLWREATNNPNAKRRQFLKMLGAELCGGELDDGGNIRLKHHIVPPATTGSRLRCRQCKSNKTVQRCKACGEPLCINCATYNCPDC